MPTGLVTRILLLGVFASLPMAALLVLQASAVRDHDLAVARDRTAEIAAITAQTTGRLIDGVRGTLTAFAEDDSAHDSTGPECDALARAIAAQAPSILGISVAAPDGSIPCSSLAGTAGTNVADRDYFQRAIATRDFALSPLITGRLSGVPTVLAAEPVLAADGTVDGVAVAAIPVNELTDVLRQAGLPGGAAATIVDAQGTVVARWPDPDAWIGHQPDTGLIDAIDSGATEDDALPGVDGTVRIYAFADIGDRAETGMRLAVGFSRDATFAAAEDRFRTTMLAFLGAVLAGIAIALLGFRLLIGGPVRRLLTATRQLADGTLSARAGHVGPGEIGELARTFDGMAAALQRRTAELEAEITARTAELSAALSEADDLYERAPVGYHSLDADRRIVRINETELRWLGYRREELLGRPIDDVLTPESRDRHLEAFQAELGGASIRDVRVELVRRDGTRFPVRISATVSLGPDGQLAQTRSVVEDLTERQLAERRASELFDAFPDPISLYEPVLADDGTVVDFRRVYANPRVADILGRDVASTIGASLLETTLEDQRDTIFETVRQVHASGEPALMPDISYADPATGEVRRSSNVVTSLDGRVALVGRDVTAERRAEAAIVEARELAESADRAKTEFLSRMSHELRTPLNAIIGFAQLLRLDSLDARQVESTDQILRAGRHLLALIDEVLDISRIESGRLSISPEPVSLRETMRDVIALVQPLAAEHGVGLDTSGVPASVYVLADRQRLRQVMLNLLTNAIKYNRPNGRVTVTGQAVASAGAAARLRVEVTDEGAGIDPSRMARVFAPFDRLGAETTGVEGTGLGLALTKALMEAMGGEVGVLSSPGNGSTFWLELPITDAPVMHEPPEVPPTVAPVPGRDRTLLYIEDNPSNFLLVERALERRPGIRLVAAMLGSLGIELAREHRPDLVLLDLHLPDIPGEAVLTRLRSDPRTANLPIVVLSAEASPRVRDRLVGLGASAYLAKPIDLAEFYEIVDRMTEPGPGATGRQPGEPPG